MPQWIAFASSAAILGWSRAGFAQGFADPKMLAICAGILGAACWHPPGWRRSRFDLPALLFLLTWIPALILSRDRARSIVGFPGMYSGGLISLLASTGGLLLSSRLSLTGRSLVKRVVLWSALCSALLCVFQALGADPFRFALPKGRAVGLIGSPIDAGAVGVAVLAFCPWAAVPALLAGILATGSRGAMLGAAVSLAPARFRPYAALLATALAMGWMFHNGAKNRSDAGRFDMWRVAAAEVSAFGTGPATFLETYESKRDQSLGEYHQGFAHNAFLDTLATRGLVGLVGLLAFLAAPQLAGVWVVSMFNPVAFEVSFVACVIAGFYGGAAYQERSLS